MSHELTISVARGYDPSAPAANLKTFFALVADFYALQHTIVKPQVWSPLVWRGGQRQKDAFQSCQLVALDFDSGEWTLDDAIQYVQTLGVAALVATTKSHRRAKTSGGKTSPPCDRFRLVIMADTCTSLDDYEYTMRQYVADLPADRACVDGARYYFPCTEVAWYQDGGRASWLTCPWVETAEARELAFGGPCDPEDYRNLWSLPYQVTVYILYGALYERHKKAYIVGCELARRGFQPHEIMSLLKAKKSPLLNIGEGKDHVGRCIENACKRVGVAPVPAGWKWHPGAEPLGGSEGQGGIGRGGGGGRADGFTVIAGGKRL